MEVLHRSPWSYFPHGPKIYKLDSFFFLQEVILCNILLGDDYVNTLFYAIFLFGVCANSRLKNRLFSFYRLKMTLQKQEYNPSI